MGAGFRRIEFVDAFNKAFGAERVENTIAQLGHQVSSMDVLEIVHRARLVDWLPQEAFFNYRDTVGIPATNLQVLTVAMHNALLARPKPHPIVLRIVEGDVESVTVSHPPSHTAITLTRTAQPSAR